MKGNSPIYNLRAILVVHLKLYPAQTVLSLRIQPFLLAPRHQGRFAKTLLLVFAG